MILIGLRILIIEDDPAQAESLQLLLRAYRVECEVARTLEAGIKRCCQDGLGCILLDLTLPDAGGIEAIERLQAKCGEVPFVVLTGHSDLYAPAIRAGAQDLLVKPYDPDALANAIRKAVVRHQVRRKYEPTQSALDSAVEQVDEAKQQVDAALGREA
jgi:FixJ family two-component response regulator